MSDFLRKTGICILNLIGAVYIGFLVDLICINIIRMNVYEDLARNLWYIIIDIATVCAVLVWRFSRVASDEGAKDQKLLPLSAVLQMVTAWVVYFFGTVFVGYNHPASLVSMAYCATLLLRDPAYNATVLVKTEYPGISFAAWLIVCALYVPAMCLGYYLGARKRKMERKQILHQK